MKAIKVLLFSVLAAIVFIFVVRAFSDKVAGLPSYAETYDSYFVAANAWFDSVAGVHTQEIPILEKIESKLYFIGKGLGQEKDGKKSAFTTLEEKLDTILGQPGTGLPLQAQSYFDSANFSFDSVSTVHAWEGDLPSAVKGYFSASNAHFDTVGLIHNDALFPDSSELYRIEQKLWHLNQALKNEKHAKRGSFEDLEAKLDTLLGQDYSIPEDIGALFDTADIYFDSVDVVHQQVGGLTDETDVFFEQSNLWFDSVNYVHEFTPFPDEWQNIEWKIHYLKHALKSQKEAKHSAFIELEAKLDTLLGWEFTGLNPDAEGYFLWANAYFDSINIIHEFPVGPEMINIEWKLHYLKLALHYQKHFKWIMFQDLEFKLDSLLHWPDQGLPEEVDSLFTAADVYFDSVNYIHDFIIFPDSTEDWKIMQKLHYFKYALKNQKEAMWLMFKELEFKLDMLAEPRTEVLPELPPEIDHLFESSDAWFDSVNFIYGQIEMPIPMKVEWMLHYLKHALKDEKDAKWMAFDELKRKVYEFDKVELKLYYLSKALKYQKDAKWRMFAELEQKLDNLLGIDYQGLPPDVDMDFEQANLFFDLVDSTHKKPGIPEMEKTEQKLLYLRDALVCQKHAVRKMFDTLNVKINTFAQIPEDSLDPDIVADFDSANYYFDQIDLIDQVPGLTELQKIELKIFYLSQGLQFVKNAMEKMFAQWKEKLFEFDKIEKKLFHLGRGSKYQKDAKEIAFKHLEEKLDTLFAGQGWTPIGFPAQVQEHFDSANAYFDQVSSTHLDPTIPELTKIQMKINLLKHGSQFQKDACWAMFSNLEEKLDSLLGRTFSGLPDTVNAAFDSANYYFDLVNALYDDPAPQGAELDKIEIMLELFTTALKFAKDAKWLMFAELEEKIDSLPPTSVKDLGEQETLPESFVLLQNYPNPFNPTTSIEFMISKPSQVKIEIFNILGERVATLVDQRLGAGHKLVEWDGKDNQGGEVSTGIYFYRLRAGDFTQTKKMVVLK